jgi:hypothetical protein
MRYIFTIASSLILVSCFTISYSFRGGRIPGETFSIESFTNQASIINPNLAIVFQDALQERFTNESNLKYTDKDQTENHVKFSGTIKKYRISPVQGTGNETVTLNRLTISVNILYSNSKEPSLNFEKEFASYDDFESSQDFSSVEEELMKTISEKLVALVYNQTIVDW